MRWLGDKDLAFSGEDYREIPIVRQGKRNYNICGITLDWSYEVLQEYGLE